MLGFRTYEQGGEKFQAETLDFVWLDEEPPHDIYMEAVTRTNTTLGPVYLTFTPLMGMSATVKRFLIDKHAGTAWCSWASTMPSTTPASRPMRSWPTAGNYKVGRTRIAGMDISIENPEGSERRGRSPDGTSWVDRMAEALACGESGRIVEARSLFWDRSNWRPLCWACHSRKTARGWRVRQPAASAVGGRGADVCTRRSERGRKYIDQPTFLPQAAQR
ncbi:hypothetical protein IUJ48_08890 [Achromobacter xylosoxidans]|nr:hypothetical protein IUJ48_08890 [Achromobacter xylosoxidans]